MCNINFRNPLGIHKYQSRHIEIFLLSVIFLSVTIGASINIYKNLSVDRSRLPNKVINHRGYQRWYTNLRNKGLDYINTNDFFLTSENEIYNTKWLKISQFEENDRESREKFEAYIQEHRNIQKVIFSPSERMFVDYRNINRKGYPPNEVQLYGVRDDKIIDARILDCSVRANCYFDRAYFISNDLFVISEFSRTIDKKDQNVTSCPIDQLCEYSIKIHLIDLINNSRLVYESKPFNIVLEKLIPEL